MRCEMAQDLLLQRQLGELDPSIEGPLDEHLMTCVDCRRIAARSAWTDLQLSVMQGLPALSSQHDAILMRARTLKRRAISARILKGAAALATAAAIGLFALRLLPDPGTPPTGQLEPADPRPTLQLAEELPADFFDQIKPGSGWVATASLPTPEGNAIAYYFVEPAPADQLQASIIVRHANGRLTREVDLGAVSFGRLPFTQPEFRRLQVGSNTLLGIATDDQRPDGSGMAQLQILAYQPEAHRLHLVTFDQGDHALSVSTWPMITPAGIRTQSGQVATEWRLTEHWTFSKLSEFAATVVRPPAGPTLAEANFQSAQGPLTVRLQGTLADGASLYLYRDAEQVQEIDLGKPHFGSLNLTQPRLHRVTVAGQELLLLLCDPVISLPYQAVLLVYAYDEARGQLRQIPFTNGEVLVAELPRGEGDLLLVNQFQWRLTDHWLLEPVASRR